MEMIRSFTITENHLNLLQRMYVEWSDECYDGAPAINLKRPYGNSDIMGDVAEILGLGTWDEMPEALENELRRLHRETDVALQICLSVGKFEVGDYQSKNYGLSWRKDKNES